MRHALLVLLAAVVMLGIHPEAAAQVDGGLPVPPADELQALKTEVAALRERLQLLEEGMAGGRARELYAPPETLEVAGEPVPLDRWDVRERLEREFYLVLGNWGQVVLWLKRSARYFPYVEGELARAGLPDDLKYVAVVESSLLPTAYSPASALGIWQFTAPTARRYGLAISAWWDERRDPQRSTRAALAYLTDLRARFGDWALALAAYNAGEGRVAQALQQQGVSSYYQLALPEETERYVLRVFAAKLILADPGRYGFEVPMEQRYQQVDADTTEVEVRTTVLVATLAKAAGSFDREIRALNPAIVQEWLPKGRYRMRVPKGQGSGLSASVTALELRGIVKPASGPALVNRRAPPRGAPCPPGGGRRRDCGRAF